MACCWSHQLQLALGEPAALLPAWRHNCTARGVPESQCGLPAAHVPLELQPGPSAKLHKQQPPVPKFALGGLQLSHRGAVGAEEPSFQDVEGSMPYADACLRETLRLYPPIPQASREATRDLVLGGALYMLPA